MAFIYGDPNPAGPFATFQIKDVVCKALKLTNTNFGTAAVNTLVAALPADSSIVRMSLWVKTQLAGGSVSAATISIGTSSGGTQFINASATAFGAASSYNVLNPAGIFQPYNIPYSSDIQIWVSGAATTGNPTSGEIYLLIEYVR